MAIYYKPQPTTPFLYRNLKAYELVAQGGVKPIERLKRIVFMVIGGKVVRREFDVSLIEKFAEKVSCNPSQTANAMIEPFGDWVNDGFNYKEYLRVTAEKAGEYSNLYPLDPIYMCSKCKCLHNELKLIAVPKTYKGDDTRLTVRKRDVIRVDYCNDCIDEVEFSFNELIAAQKTINKGKKVIKDVKNK